MNISLDGFLSGPDCELDWHFKYWSPEMAAALANELSHADTILFGRITYLAMAQYWSSKAMALSCAEEDRAFIQMMDSYRKIVVSRTIEKLPWNNSTHIDSNIKASVVKLKSSPGKNIMLYGSSKLIPLLLKQKLINEFHLYVHPVALGKGKALFPGMEHLRFIRSQVFASGVVLLVYSTAP
jgi:dihydrofolate reductase